MKILSDALTALLGLFILASAVAGVVHRPGDWTMIALGALKGLIGITTNRAAGFVLQQKHGFAAHTESLGK